MFLSTICRKEKYEDLIFRRREIWLSKGTAKKTIPIRGVMNKQSLLTILNRGSTTLQTIAYCGPFTLVPVAEFCRFTLKL